jgi:hypothetical protein
MPCIIEHQNQHQQNQLANIRLIKILSSSWFCTTHAVPVLLGSDCNIQQLGTQAQWLALC